MDGYRLDEIGVQSFADAVAAWVDFQIHCGRSSLLSEKYLTQPIAEFLGTRFKTDAVHAEWPIGEETDKVGRPRQMDFVVKSAGSGAPTMVIETKWVNNFDTGQKKGLVMDIMRLHAYPWKDGKRLPKGKSQCLFILAGTATAMKEAMKKAINMGHGIPRHPFLSLVLSEKKNSESEIKPADLPQPLIEMFQSFKNEYDLNLPVTYKSTLLGERKLKTVHVKIWQIRRV